MIQVTSRERLLRASCDRALQLGMELAAFGVGEDAASAYAADWLTQWDADNAAHDLEANLLAEAFATGYCRHVV